MHHTINAASPSSYYEMSCMNRDENGTDTNGYHICFHIYVRIRIRIVSTMPDRIRLDIDVINIRFEYSDMDTVSDVKYSDLDTD
jgi:hypothetical protein